MTFSLGVDIGGTKIATVLMDRDGKIQNRSEVPSDPTDKEKMFEQVIKSIDQILEESQTTLQEIQGVGVGVPGKIDRENGIAVFQNNLPWTNFPIVSRLQEHLSIENITLDNDVCMAAFAEWKVSNATKQDTFVYITISTGIACSVIHEGAFMRGKGFTGEIGLFPVIANGQIEALEKVASGPGIKKLAEKRFNDPNISTADFFSKYKEEDKEATKLMLEIADSLAHGVYSIICLLDPHKIVFGGGVMNNNPFLLELIKEALKKYLIPEQLHSLEILYISSLKGDSGVVGAGLKGFF
ncbi:ROK family protein [Psychrobacillus sp.]|uniref:ROK family protein n=1 Tax=Psychrobacillus sp. TaxID=1871623 RepID=UPI0028BEC883|nr:ROK family protein [Psychrobacillus sp.]